ncbi:hypothetical protein Acr_00g0079140 [Actinidia rufa]|uniref:PGG domain-containing protein n=1 Tax=Actinidia rufa TaxID=165716 RepID=A0A7J0DU20_9ERIC|nr:hypothetical protein Acr_00g0079140 [Actinidia rufa]
MSTQTMEEAQTILRDAARVGDINGLYNSIRLVPNILDHVDDTPFVDSPMHIAASAGHANFAIEIFSLKSSFGRKLNSDGLSPLHLAFRTSNKWLLQSKDDIGNTVLHTAVATSQPQMVKLLVKNDLANKNFKNLNGDTALDIALRLQPGVAQTTIENILRGARASRSSSLAHRDLSFADFLKSREKIPEKISKHIFQMNRNMSMEMRNIVLVVAALIATATFQAVLSPPGGVCGGNDNNLLPNGTLINTTVSSTNLIPFSNISHINATDNYENGSSYEDDFIDFYVLNSLAFLASVTAIIVALPIDGFEGLHVSLLFLMASYGISFNFISPSCSHAKRFKLLSSIYVCFVYCLIISKTLYTRLSVSHVQRKRIPMLYWLVVNSSNYSKKGCL